MTVSENSFLIETNKWQKFEEILRTSILDPLLSSTGI